MSWATSLNLRLLRSEAPMEGGQGVVRGVPVGDEDALCPADDIRRGQRFRHLLTDPVTRHELRGVSQDDGRMLRDMPGDPLVVFGERVRPG